MSFQLELKKFADNYENRLDTVNRATMLSLFSAIILDTPVKTGRLRGNWQTTIGSPATGTLGTKSKSGNVSIKRAKQNAGEVGETTYFTNNLPYAARIEDGYGKNNKAGGMVALNVLRYRRILKQELRNAS